VTEKFHEGVDADIRVGKLGCKGVPQSMDECAGRPFTIDPGPLESPRESGIAAFRA
jgi:hypothetical protein